jgi:hypothetical protein
VQLVISFRVHFRLFDRPDSDGKNALWKEVKLPEKRSALTSTQVSPGVAMLDTVAFVPDDGPSVATNASTNSFPDPVDKGPAATVVPADPWSFEMVWSIPIAAQAGLTVNAIQAITARIVKPALLIIETGSRSHSYLF